MFYEILGKTVFIDGKTGLFSFNETNYDLMLKRDNFNFDLYEPRFYEYNTTSVTFCINLSDSCNLACDYCFNPKKQNKNISVENALAFLKVCFLSFPDKEKYFVDLSGKGEDTARYFV